MATAADRLKARLGIPSGLGEQAKTASARLREKLNSGAVEDGVPKPLQADFTPLTRETSTGYKPDLIAPDVLAQRSEALNTRILEIAKTTTIGGAGLAGSVAGGVVSGGTGSFIGGTLAATGAREGIKLAEQFAGKRPFQNVSEGLKGLGESFSTSIKEEGLGLGLVVGVKSAFGVGKTVFNASGRLLKRVALRKTIRPENFPEETIAFFEKASAEGFDFTAGEIAQLSTSRFKSTINTLEKFMTSLTLSSDLLEAMNSKRIKSLIRQRDNLIKKGGSDEQIKALGLQTRKLLDDFFETRLKVKSAPITEELNRAQTFIKGETERRTAAITEEAGRAQSFIREKAGRAETAVTEETGRAQAFVARKTEEVATASRNFINIGNKTLTELKDAVLTKIGVDIKYDDLGLGIQELAESQAGKLKAVERENFNLVRNAIETSVRKGDLPEVPKTSTPQATAAALKAKEEIGRIRLSTESDAFIRKIAKAKPKNQLTWQQLSSDITILGDKITSVGANTAEGRLLIQIKQGLMHDRADFANRIGGGVKELHDIASASTVEFSRFKKVPAISRILRKVKGVPVDPARIVKLMKQRNTAKFIGEIKRELGADAVLPVKASILQDIFSVPPSGTFTGDLGLSRMRKAGNEMLSAYFTPRELQGLEEILDTFNYIADTVKREQDVLTVTNKASDKIISTIGTMAEKSRATVQKTAERAMQSVGSVAEKKASTAFKSAEKSIQSARSMAEKRLNELNNRLLGNKFLKNLLDNESPEEVLDIVFNRAMFKSVKNLRRLKAVVGNTHFSSLKEAFLEKNLLAQDRQGRFLFDEVQSHIDKMGQPALKFLYGDRAEGIQLIADLAESATRLKPGEQAGGITSLFARFTELGLFVATPLKDIALFLPRRVLIKSIFLDDAFPTLVKTLKSVQKVQNAKKPTDHMINVLSGNIRELTALTLRLENEE